MRVDLDFQVFKRLNEYLLIDLRAYEAQLANNQALELFEVRDLETLGQAVFFLGPLNKFWNSIGNEVQNITHYERSTSWQAMWLGVVFHHRLLQNSQVLDGRETVFACYSIQLPEQ